MKKSRRYLLGTIASIAGVIVLSVTSLRLFGLTEEVVPTRPDPTDLAALENFTAISATGDFRLEVIQQDNFSVDYEVLAQTGSLDAKVVGNELQLSGFSNTANGQVSVVKVGMPVLEQLSSNYQSSVAVEGFNGSSLSLSFNYIRDAAISENNIAELSLYAVGTGTISLQGNSIESQHLQTRGNITINSLPLQP